MQAFCGCERRGMGGVHVCLWRGGGFRNKDNWCVRSFPCQTQRRAKEEKFKSESTSEEKKKKGIACFAEITSATATRCLKEFSSRSQENEEDIRMWWINDHHHSNWKSQGSPRWSADAREIPLCLQRLLQGLCYWGETYTYGSKFKLPSKRMERQAAVH